MKHEHIPEAEPEPRPPELGEDEIEEKNGEIYLTKPYRSGITGETKYLKYHYDKDNKIVEMWEALKGVDGKWRLVEYRDLKAIEKAELEGAKLRYQTRLHEEFEKGGKEKDN